MCRLTASVFAWRAAPESEYMLRLNTLLHFFVHWRVNTGRRRKEDLCLNRWVQRHRAVWYLGRSVSPSQPIRRWGFLFHFLVYMYTHVLRVRCVAHPNSCLCCQTFITAGNECTVLLLLRMYWTDGAAEHFITSFKHVKHNANLYFIVHRLVHAFHVWRHYCLKEWKTLWSCYTCSNFISMLITLWTADTWHFVKHTNVTTQRTFYLEWIYQLCDCCIAAVYTCFWYIIPLWPNHQNKR